MGRNGETLYITQEMQEMQKTRKQNIEDVFKPAPKGLKVGQSICK